MCDSRSCSLKIVSFFVVVRDMGSAESSYCEEATLPYWQVAEGHGMELQKWVPGPTTDAYIPAYNILHEPSDISMYWMLWKGLWPNLGQPAGMVRRDFVRAYWERLDIRIVFQPPDRWYRRYTLVRWDGWSTSWQVRIPGPFFEGEPPSEFEGLQVIQELDPPT